MPQCLLYLIHTHDTNHLFNGSYIPTQHYDTSLWTKPLKAAEVIQELGSRLACLSSRGLRDGYFKISLEEGQQQQQHLCALL